MSSTQMPMPKFTVAREHVYIGAVVLLLVLMLTGIASVAGHQVQKAQARESMLASQRSAVAHCVEVMRGAELNSCIQKAKADVDGPQTMAVVSNSSAFSRSSAGSSSTQGFTPVAFSSLR
jgi:hypothetical protein